MKGKVVDVYIGFVEIKLSYGDSRILPITNKFYFTWEAAYDEALKYSEDQNVIKAWVERKNVMIVEECDI